MANFYNLSAGGSQTAATYPVQPVTLAAAATAQAITVTWDETDLVGDLIQIQYSLGTVGTGTVTTEEGTALTGDVDAVFTEELVVGDWIVIDGETAQVSVITADDDVTLASAFSAVVEGGDFGIIGSWADLACVATGVETYTHSSLTAEIPYFYRIRTHYRTKWSDWSDPVGDFTEAEA